MDVYILILLGIHQIWHSPIKPHALVNEVVSVADLIKKPWAKGVLNACLRRVLREKTAWLDAQYPSHPAWMMEHIKKAWPDDWVAIIAANDVQAPMTLRINTQRDHEAILADLQPLAVRVRSHSGGASMCLYLSSPLGVHDIPGFSAGVVSVQDEASQYVAALLQLRSGDVVLDACSAPGGKTGHMLELQPAIRLTACDISDMRLEKVKENLERLGVEKEVVYHVCDVTQYDWDGEVFDKILLDAPCSGSGVIRRHPDIKLLRRESDLRAFSDQQQRLLQALWPALKKGGKLLYTTCSIMPEENEGVIKEFLKHHDDADIPSIQLSIGVPQERGWQCFPQVGGHDGFYYCLIEKT
ncbi:MAG: 16S rRNA (cytosine(967)-C(5))-methyltransferase RsmB [Gammaproteobacteria bacterium]|nr:16S rRNA (cytosine(967)-C(5))-methyltransferase RsmB [Gammaproteobacteria bacterium]